MLNAKGGEIEVTRMTGVICEIEGIIDELDRIEDVEASPISYERLTEILALPFRRGKRVLCRDGVLQLQTFELMFESVRNDAWYKCDKICVRSNGRTISGIRGTFPPTKDHPWTI
jgi:hypothetical protein